MWNWLRKLFRRGVPASSVPSTQGTVKRIVRDKGFGFIRSADGQEVFFHRSALVGLELRTLSEGQRVEFVLEESPKGLRASNVRATREKAERERREGGENNERAQSRAQGEEDGIRPGNANGRQQEDRNRPPRHHGRRGRRKGAEGQRGREER